MDFYKYINSKDVAEYLRKINFHLNPLQCLWIIFQNENITLNEKTQALEYILEMPDYEFESYEYPSGVGVHRIINDYLDYIKSIKEEFKSKDEDCFYTGFIIYEEYTTHLAIYFKDYESCLEHTKETFANTVRVVLGYEIHKIPFDTYEDTIKATFQGEVLTSIHKCGDYDPLINILAYENELIKLNSPFKPGDILYDLIEQRPVVLESVSNEDMSAICHRISDDDKTIEKDYVMFFTNLVYYDNELTGKDIALYPLSDFIKNIGEIKYGLCNE